MVTKITSYFHSDSLFEIAKRAADDNALDQDAPIIAIMFSVLALEAFINESGALARMVPTDKRQNIIEGFSTVMGELEDRKESLLIKYHMGLLVFTGSTWNEGAQPFQDFKLLVVLRNAIVHMKADRWEVKIGKSKPDPERRLDQYPKFVRTLQQKGLIELETTSGSWFEVIKQPKVSRWACQTAETITREFINSVPGGYYKNEITNYALSIKEKG